MPKRSSAKPLHAGILGVLNEIEDPELGIGIVDAGLVYRAEWRETGIEIDVTTTAPSCPFAAWFCQRIDGLLRERFSSAASVLVRLVSDPPWTLDRLSADARRALGWAGRGEPSITPFALACWNTSRLRPN